MNIAEIVFRVDASTTIGTGHIMRCLTLAKQLKQNINEKRNISFICRHILPSLHQQIIESGYHFYLLENNKENKIEKNNDHQSWLGVTSQQDAEETIAILQDKAIDWIIVDHYAIDDKWEKKVKTYVKKIMIIDDLANRPHDCDLLLDQTYGRSLNDYKNLLPICSILLSGADYTLLRKEFILEKNSIIKHRKNINFNHITALIMFGGTDPDNLTKLCIEKIKNVATIHKIVIIISDSTNNKNEIIAQYRKNKKIDIHISPKNIAEIMLNADIAIGAAGTSSWERCAVGLPAVVIIQAENQRLIAENLQRQGVITYLETQDIDKKLISLIEQHLLSKEVYLTTVIKCLDICDGNGVKKVANTLGIVSSLSVRDATTNDMLTYFKWASHSKVRKQAFNQQDINFIDHKAWFKSKLLSDSFLFVGVLREEAIGQVRFDKLDKTDHYSVDIHLSHNHIGKGYGTYLLNKALIELLKRHSSPLYVEAVVFQNNLSSRRCFENNFFTINKKIKYKNKTCYQYLWAA